ncbi:hypothetical protein [Mycolicibacterium madagascariense]|nr:hypothetical protein [Mycolicibacterium madagascariense]MCV7013328.1 hypothetical protein [Mycolicibacterium madagascariense]
MTTRDIPPADTATDPIGSTADLRQRWRALMGPGGFGERLLRFVFVGPDRRMLKILSDVPVDRYPQPGLVRNLMVALREILDAREGHTVALLLTRPGEGAVCPSDRRWAQLLTEIAAEFGVPIEPVCLATDDRLLILESGSGQVAVGR